MAPIGPPDASTTAPNKKKKQYQLFLRKKSNIVV